jgi:hypothetical protein
MWKKPKKRGIVTNVDECCPESQSRFILEQCNPAIRVVTQ